MGRIKTEIFGKQANAVAIIFKILGSPCRLAIIKILSTEGCKTNKELVERIGGLKQSTISEHIRLLSELKIIRSVPYENTVRYYIWEEMWSEIKGLIKTYADGGDKDIEI